MPVVLVLPEDAAVDVLCGIAEKHEEGRYGGENREKPLENITAGIWVNVGVGFG